LFSSQKEWPNIPSYPNSPHSECGVLGGCLLVVLAPTKESAVVQAAVQGVVLTDVTAVMQAVVQAVMQVVMQAVMQAVIQTVVQPEGRHSVVPRPLALPVAPVLNKNRRVL
jgi:hypothetical protein